MKVPKVILYKKAIDSVLLSTIGIYKREIHGFLYGNREDFGNELHIREAIPNIKAKLTYKATEFLGDDGRTGSLETLLKLKHLGYFHSHTDYRNKVPFPSPSDDDKKDLIKLSKNINNYVSLIVSVKASDCSYKGIIYRENSLQIAWDIPSGKKLFILKAYYFNKKLNKIDDAFLIPSASLSNFIKSRPLYSNKNGKK